MIKRLLEAKLRAISEKMPVLTITGPRQSGKTTLARMAFPEHEYVSLENPESRSFAQNDPRGFLAMYSRGLIIDEVQYAPDLFSYIQTIVDDEHKNGRFVLTGSQNFLLQQKIPQSLAGRAAIYNLLPFSMDELKSSGHAPAKYEELLFKGFYPRIYHEKLNPVKWLSDYIRTYVERDVRQLLNIGDLNQFQNFLSLCAGRVGQNINHAALSNDAGVSNKTVHRWISVLEASYIIFLLKPYHRNFRKRIIKSPKLYFYDVGLASHLLKITNAGQIQTHFAKGALFENLVIGELLKRYWNSGEEAPFYFWRDSNTNEVDLIIERGTGLTAVEIKAGKTIQEDMLKGLLFWQRLSGAGVDDSYVVYGGETEQKRTNARIIGWKNISTIQ